MAVGRLVETKTTIASNLCVFMLRMSRQDLANADYMPKKEYM